MQYNLTHLCDYQKYFFCLRMKIKFLDISWKDLRKEMSFLKIFGVDESKEISLLYSRETPNDRLKHQFAFKRN